MSLQREGSGSESRLSMAALPAEPRVTHLLRLNRTTSRQSVDSANTSTVSFQLNEKQFESSQENLTSFDEPSTFPRRQGDTIPLETLQAGIDSKIETLKNELTEREFLLRNKEAYFGYTPKKPPEPTHIYAVRERVNDDGTRFDAVVAVPTRKNDDTGPKTSEYWAAVLASSGKQLDEASKAEIPAHIVALKTARDLLKTNDAKAHIKQLDIPPAETRLAYHTVSGTPLSDRLYPRATGTKKSYTVEGNRIRKRYAKMEARYGGQTAGEADDSLADVPQESPELEACRLELREYVRAQRVKKAPLTAAALIDDDNIEEVRAYEDAVFHNKNDDAEFETWLNDVNTSSRRPLITAMDASDSEGEEIPARNAVVGIDTSTRPGHNLMSRVLTAVTHQVTDDHRQLQRRESRAAMERENAILIPASGVVVPRPKKEGKKPTKLIRRETLQHQHFLAATVPVSQLGVAPSLLQDPEGESDSDD